MLYAGPFAGSYGIQRDILIGAADINAADLSATGGPIVAFEVISGSGKVAYTAAGDGASYVVGDLLALSANGVPVGPVAIKTIHGTSNDAPSDALTLRVLV